MVQAIIDISKDANQVLNIVKARFNLKDKSEAIEKVALDYGGEMLEPALRPEYIEKAKKIMKQKPVHIGTMDDFRKRYGIK